MGLAIFLKHFENHENLRWVFKNCRKSSENIARVARKSVRMFLFFFFEMSHLFRFLAHRASCYFDKNSFFFFVIPVIHVRMKVSRLSPFEILDIRAL